ncbi:T9SS type A sorting domain-containing protein [Flavobacterium limnophilum]|uniref:T9SS type A sorting domain-containing protein n=1 Tax=Flavobacterium limnophilum TaxID=3003262 RepID=UPI0024825A06|nr:T9SS type A sorting domain-containing protein [Flavobacterium limnophilum]
MKKSTLLKFFEVLSSKIRCCLFSKSTISRLGFFRNENVDSSNSKFNGHETQEQTANFSVPQVGIPTSNTKIMSRVFYTFWIAFLLFAMLPISAVGQITYCAGDPVPSTQTSLRDNPAYVRGQCPANDIQILSARIVKTNDLCNTCTPRTTITADLYIKVHHNTNSDDRYLGVFADLTETISGSTTTCTIARCGGPVVKSASEIDGGQEIYYGQITFTCGSQLNLSDILLVWTAANGACPVTLQNNPNGKYCYSNADVPISQPFNAVAKALCGTGNTANIDLTVSGGSGDFSYDWNNDGTGDFNDTQNLTNVPLGTYVVVVRDNVKKDENNNLCTATTTITFNGPCCEFFATCNLDAAEQLIEGCGVGDLPAPFTVPTNVFTSITTNPCGDLVLIHDDASSGSLCPDGLKVTRTYTLFDDLNDNQILDAGEEFVTCEENFKVVDRTDPTASNPAPVTVQCIGDVPASDIAVVTDEADNCGVPVVAFVSDLSDGNTCPEVITRTYSVTDACLNQILVTQTITVDDNINPTASNPDPVTVACIGDVPSSNIAVVTDEADNCGVPVVAFVSDVSDGNTCPEVITRTYSVTDACLNQILVTQTITVDDNINPTATNPDPVTVACIGDVPAANIAVVDDEADNCSVPVVAFVSDVSDGKTCPEVITRTYSVTDACLNQILVTQTITVDDNINPTATNPDPVTVACIGDVPSSNIAVVTDEADNCGVPVVAFVSDVSDGNTCPEVITRTYSVTDACLNQILVTQTITVDDNINPTATNPDPVTVACIGDVPAANIAVVDDEADNCSVPVVAFVSDVSDGKTCPEVITRTYSVTDACLNQILVTQTITVDDNINPTATNPDPVTVACIGDVPAANIAVVDDEADNCGVPVVAFVSDLSDGNTCPEVITRTYSVTDACLNQILVTQTITVDDDTDPTASNPAPVAVQCIGDVPASDIAVVTDEADNCGVPVVAFVSDLSDGNTCPEVITRTYSVTDACLNQILVTQTITVDDNINPTATNPDPVTVACIGDVPAANIAVVDDEADNCGVPVVAFVSDVSDGKTCPEVITRKYSVTDACLNQILVTQTITVDDNINPTATNPDPVTVACIGDVPAANIAVVDDEADNCGVPVVAFVSDVSDGKTCPEVITRTYSVTDACLNQILVTQTITVDDNINPTATNPDPVTVACIGDVPAANIAVVDDEADNCGVPVVAFVSDLSDGNTCPEVITRTYSVTDACLNQILVTQTITVDDDTDPTASNPAPVAVQCIGDVPASDIAVVTDEADNCGVPVVAFVSDLSDGNTCPEVITRTYSVTDACLNQILVTQTITVDDNINPTATNPDPVTVACIGDVPAANIAVVDDEADNCGVPVVAFVSDVSDGKTCPEVITRKYSVTDACLNQILVTQTITVDDNINPTATNPDPVTVACIGDVPAANIAVVDDEADNCGVPVVAFVSDVSDGKTCPEVITRTYSVTDACLNQILVTQTITVDDNINPTATNPDPVTVACIGDVPAANIAVVDDEADNCGVPVVAFVSDLSDGNTCPEVITRTYSVTDACLNQILVTQTITVDDDTDPTASNPAPVTVACIGDVPASDIAVVTDEADNCGVPVVAFVSDLSDGNTCPEVITRTYSVTDACLNQILVTQIITVDDTLAPVFTCPTATTVACDVDIVFTAPAVSDNCDDTITPTKSGDVVVNSTRTSFTQKWTATDDCGNNSECTQTINRPACGGHIYPTATTCASFKNGAPQLDAICYQMTKKGGGQTVSNATPGVFFYYTYITAPSSAFTVDIFQANTNPTFKLFEVSFNDVNAWNASCTKIATGYQSASGQATIEISGVTGGDIIVISVKYDTKSLIGSTFTGKAPDVTYYFGSLINGNDVAGSLGSVLVSNCKTTKGGTSAPIAAKIDAAGFDAYPVPFKDQLTIKYNFDYATDVKIEVFNAQGISVLTKVDTNSYLNKEITLDLHANKDQEQMYLVKVTTNRGSSIKKVLSSK